MVNVMDSLYRNSTANVLALWNSRVFCTDFKTIGTHFEQYKTNVLIVSTCTWHVRTSCNGRKSSLIPSFRFQRSDPSSSHSEFNGIQSRRHWDFFCVNRKIHIQPFMKGSMISSHTVSSCNTERKTASPRKLGPAKHGSSFLSYCTEKSDVLDTIFSALFYKK